MFARLLPPLLVLLALTACNAQREERGPIVLAASSLQEAMEKAADLWAAQGNPRPVLSIAASSALARQIESGAPADIFLSADEGWMDALEREDLLRPGTRRTLLGNSLVLIARIDAPRTVTPPSGELRGLADSLGTGRLAMGDPSGVPAGRYTKAALENLGQWDALKYRIAPAENVRAALALIERGAAPRGIVYGTDAAASNRVRVEFVIPEESHPPIRYPIALLARSQSPDAEELATWLATPEAFAIFVRHGFTRPR